jgi:uncharacterized protein (TIGR02246 family)
MRINVCRVFGCFALAMATCGVCVAQEAETSSESQTSASDPRAEDLAAIRAGAKTFADAFNNKDAEAIAAMWVEEGEYIDESGRRYSGREAIKKNYAELFEDGDESQIRIMIDSVRMLGHEAAIEEGRAVVEPAPIGSPGFSKYTVMHLKVDGTWLMASVRDTWIETPSTHKNLADLQWLIGTWNAEEHGIKTESVCRWVANKSFVERRYTTTHADGTKSSGVQLIGWNPRFDSVQSWNFSPDGGHAVGLWSPVKNGWAAQMHGVTGSGAMTRSFNTLQRLDDNAYVWQSVQRSMGVISLPDTDEVVLKRQTEAR